MTRFGMLETLILNNNFLFNSKVFRKYCNDLGIKNRSSSLSYPKSNRQTEATNKTIVNGLNKRLKKSKGKWDEELPNVLWTYQTTHKRSIGETPFSMTCKTEAVIPVEIGLASMRIIRFSLCVNNLMLTEQLHGREQRDSIHSIDRLPAETV